MNNYIYCILLSYIFYFSNISYGKYSFRNNVSSNYDSIDLDQINNNATSHDESFQIQLPVLNITSKNTTHHNLNDTNINFVNSRFLYKQNNEDYSNNNNSNGSSSSNNNDNNSFGSLVSAVYLFSSICFIFCLRGLSNHETSRKGNILGYIGILAAIVITFTQVRYSFRYELFLLIVIPAVVLGIYITDRVDMIQMPQLVALFHSFVGLASLFVNFSKFHSEDFLNSNVSILHLCELYVGTFIASITFIGSLVAAGKLSGLLESRSLKLKSKKLINIICMIIIVILGYHFIVNDFYLTRVVCLYVSFMIELFFGFHLTVSIGGADMPVVLSLLNSYSGFTTSITGFLLNNNLLIIAGSLIGSSGAILSYIMSKGMNRNIINIIFGSWTDEEDEEEAEEIDDKKKSKKIKTVTIPNIINEIVNSKRIIIVPGYGVAVSKCQRELSEIYEILKTQNIEIIFAIHPVAGRMPGHLNVLLAEANIPYNIVKEMKDVNNIIQNSDIVLIIGANDIVNPSSYDPNSKIYGMPVIEAWKSKKVFILKRTLSTGYSAIDNPLFYYDNAYLLFGDAKQTTSQIVNLLNDYAMYSKKVDYKLLKDEEDEHDILSISSSTHTSYESIIIKDEADIEEVETEYPKFRRVIGIVNGDSIITSNVVSDVDQEIKNNLIIVPMIPKFIPKLKKMGFRVLVEQDIGNSILIKNEDYRKYGAEIDSRENILKQSNILLRVDPPKTDFIRMIPDNTVCISYLWPRINTDLINEIVNITNANITYIAIDEVPRISRAQKLDIRSSMSNLQGYRAVIESFYMLSKFSKSSITAAGKIKPSKVFIIGAGVSGLQAIITAKSLGAIVYAYDTRKETEEEVKSCGGIYIHISNKKEDDQIMNDEEYMEAQRNVFSKIVKKCDIVICTANIIGKKSPKLITTDMIKLMKSGSVVMDLATEFGDKENNWGGNVECSISNKNIIINNVHILGRDKIERNMPLQASELFSMNIINLLEELGGGLQFHIDMNNDIIKNMVVIKDRQIIYSEEKQLAKQASNESIFLSKKEQDIFDQEKKRITTATVDDKLMKQEIKKKTILDMLNLEDYLSSDMSFTIILLIILSFFILLGTILKKSELQNLFLFILSLIIGYNSVWSVTPSLHTPLMSVTNALSGIIIIGSMIEYGNGFQDISTILSLCATFLAALNLSGGFYVTKRMLDMFSR